MDPIQLTTRHELLKLKHAAVGAVAAGVLAREAVDAATTPSGVASNHQIAYERAVWPSPPRPFAGILSTTFAVRREVCEEDGGTRRIDDHSTTDRIDTCRPRVPMRRPEVAAEVRHGGRVDSIG